MSKRTGDLWWVSPPRVVGALVLAIFFAVAGLAIFLLTSGKIQEAVLTTALGIFLLCFAIVDLLGELVGSIRDLSGRVGGSRTKQSDESG